MIACRRCLYFMPDKSGIIQALDPPAVTFGLTSQKVALSDSSCMVIRSALTRLYLSHRITASMSTNRVTRSTTATQPVSNSSTVPSTAPPRVAKRAKPQSKKSTEGEAEHILHTPLSEATNGHSPPATPPPKRTRLAPPPETPTPAQASLYSGLPSTSTAPATHPLESRPADPHTTSAPLKTPRGSRVVAYPPSVPSSSISHPPTAHLPAPTTTTAHILEEACAHLISIEPRLASVVSKHHCRIFSPAGLAEEIDPFNSLVSGIIAQQVSGAAASSIKKKFVALFTPNPSENSTSTAPSNPNSDSTFLSAPQNEDGDSNPDATSGPLPENGTGGFAPDLKFPTPTAVASTPLPTLRTAGLSQRKAEYIQGLAEKFASGELSAKMLVEASDEEVLERLMAVRGLGRWSVEMFACFALKRMDVFSVGDLGVQ